MNYMNNDEEMDIEDQELEEMLQNTIKQEKEFRAVKSIEDETKMLDPNNKYGDNKKEEITVLNAMISTGGNENAAVKLAQVQTVSDINRALDKMATRRDFGKAIINHNVTMDRIVGRLEDFMFNPVYHPNTALKSIGMVTKMMGINEDDGKSTQSDTLENVLRSALEKEKQRKVLNATKVDNIDTDNDDVIEYEVKRPGVPNSIQKIREEEQKIMGSI